MNHRVFYAVEQVGFATDGATTFVAAHGVQSIGITTTFNLEQVFEVGQIAVLSIVEQVPDIEVTVEKVLDGAPLLYHLATKGATSGTLAGRSNIRTTICLSVFADSSDSATGTPIAEVSMSGLVVSSVAYAFTVDGMFTESVSLVGNSKVWRDVEGGATAQFTGVFNNADTAPNDLNGGGGIQKRDSLLYVPWTGITSPTGVDVNGQVAAFQTVLPTDIYGVTSSGTNPTLADGTFAVPVQSINVSSDLGRESIFELGRKFPYWKFVSSVIEVKTDIEVLATKMDNVSATEAGGVNGAPAGYNLKNQTIRVQLKDGTKVDTGTRNKLTSVSFSGGDARQGGGNVTNRYSYVTYNTLNVYHPADPSGLS